MLSLATIYTLYFRLHIDYIFDQINYQSIDPLPLFPQLRSPIHSVTPLLTITLTTIARWNVLKWYLCWTPRLIRLYRVGPPRSTVAPPMLSLYSLP